MVRSAKWSAVLLLAPACLFLCGPRLQAQYQPPFTVQFASGSYSVSQTNGMATLTVTLTTQSSAAVTVNYATSDGTAVAGTDYTAASGMVTFAPGVTSQPVIIGILNSGNYFNQSLYFTVTLSNPSTPVALGTPAFSTINILNANPAPVAVIGIDGVPPGQKITLGGFVAVNANNDNGSALTYADGTLVPTDKATGKPLFPGIPTMRDLDPKTI